MELDRIFFAVLQRIRRKMLTYSRLREGSHSRQRNRGTFFCWYIFLLHPIYILALLSPSVAGVTQTRGHIAGPPLQPPTTVRAFTFIARITQYYFLPLSARVELH